MYKRILLAYDGSAEGRAEHQGPEVDGTTLLAAPTDPASANGAAGATGWRVGELVRAIVVATEGVDLVAEPVAGERR